VLDMIDHPAHRRAHHVRVLDLEVVEQADPVGRHVGQRVRDRPRPAQHEPRPRGRRDVGEVGRAARVAVVEPDHEEPTFGQL